MQRVFVAGVADVCLARNNAKLRHDARRTERVDWLRCGRSAVNPAQIVSNRLKFSRILIVESLSSGHISILRCFA